MRSVRRPQDGGYRFKAAALIRRSESASDQIIVKGRAGLKASVD
jgi:hypothetical protein